jgi:hypothetical protein
MDQENPDERQNAALMRARNDRDKSWPQRDRPWL